MQNLELKLQLMTHLQSLGVEPGMWYEPRHGGFVLFHAPQYKGSWQVSSAYIPLEQVLELITKHSPYHSVSYIADTLETSEDEFYLAALKLLVQVVEKYPEAVKNV